MRVLISSTGTAFVTGIILLGGFNPAHRDLVVRRFRAKGAHIISIHDKKAFSRKPFMCLTAAVDFAARISSKKLVVITASWVDILVNVLGVRSLSEVKPRTFIDLAQELHKCIIISRIIDRVMLRHGVVHCFPPNVADISDAAFPGMSKRKDVVVAQVRLDQDWIDAAIAYAPFLQRMIQDCGSTRNLNGNVDDADFYLIGDKINPRFRHLKHWPFHDDSSSAFFITSILHHLGVPEHRLVWSNANDQDFCSILSHCQRKQGQLNVVALGQESLKRLRQSSVVPHDCVPHPSWARRFNKRDEYVNSLSTVFCQHHSRSVPSGPSSRAVLTGV